MSLTKITSIEGNKFEGTAEIPHGETGAPYGEIYTIPH